MASKVQVMEIQTPDGELVEFSIRSAYGPRSRQVKLFKKPSLTKGSFKKECDINEIMARYQKSGVIDAVQKTGARYGDFSLVSDYKSALDQVMAAEAAFMELPAKVRERFKNDPSELVEFLNDEENREEARDLGLIPPQTDEVPAEPPGGDKKEPPAPPAGE